MDEANANNEDDHPLDDTRSARNRNDDSSSHSSAANAALLRRNLDRARQRELDPARAATAATAARLRGAQAQGNDDNNQGNVSFDDICCISLVPPPDPVTLEGHGRIYSRRSLLTWLERCPGNGIFIHPVTREPFSEAEFRARMTPVTGLRLQRIMEERQRQGLSNE